MIFDVVEYLDPTGEIMVYRLPQEGYGDFTTGSQLIVHENQVCVFYYDGQIADTFTAGRYTLETQNLPIIKTLSKLIFKGKTPFRAFVNFVNMKTYTDLTWGTPQPILFRDAEFKMVNVRAFGTYAIRIKDPKLFLNTIVGAQGLKATDQIGSYLRKVIVSRFTNTMPSIMTTVLDLPAQYDTIAAKTKQAVWEDFGQYGIELVDMIVENINLPPEVQQAIDRAAGTRAFDDRDVAKYQQIAAADALKNAAASGGAPELTAGLGLGAGVAMGQKFVSDMAAGAQQAAPPQQPAVAAGPTCPKCRNPIEREFVLCPICKFRLKRPCANEACKKMLDAAWDTCPYCGTDQPPPA